MRKFLFCLVALLLFFTATACSAATTSIDSIITPQSSVPLSIEKPSVAFPDTSTLTPTNESNTDLSVSTTMSYLDPVSSKTLEEAVTNSPRSDTLITGCQCDTSTRNFQNNGLDIGEMAVDFTLRDVNGKEYSLSKLLDKPVVMIFGSFTWPPFRQKCPAIELLYSKYENIANFIIIYTIDAHPAVSTSPYYDREATSTYSNDKEGLPVLQPGDYEGRVELARKTINDTGLTIPVLVDEFNNPVWCTYGPSPNCAYLIGTDGSIVEKEGWLDPQKMEQSLIKYSSTIDPEADE